MKRCVITGAASGIGLALAELFIARGYAVVGVDRDRAGAEALEAQLPGVSFIHADLARSEDLGRVAAALSDGPTDLLIHSAGISAVGAFARAEIAAQTAVLEVNLRAPLQLTRALLTQGSLRRDSSVVFISSLSHFVSYPGAAVYAASKDGVAAFARSLGVALKPQGVHVLCVFPGPTRTPHAARYSPDNRLEARRMPPERVALEVERALETSRRRLVPGVGNRLFALLGHYLPALTERVMLRTVFARLEDDDA